MISLSLGGKKPLCASNMSTVVSVCTRLHVHMILPACSNVGAQYLDDGEAITFIRSAKVKHVFPGGS